MGPLNGFVFKSLYSYKSSHARRLDAIRAKLINTALHSTWELTGVNMTTSYKRGSSSQISLHIEHVQAHMISNIRTSISKIKD